MKKHTFHFTLYLLIFSSIGFTQAQESEEITCKQYVLPKVIITNNSNTPLQQLEIGYKIDGKDKGSFSWTGNLSVFQSQVVTLPTLSLIKGMNTFSIYAKDQSTADVTIDWADYQDEGQQIITPEADEKEALKTTAHTDDCNCLKAADKELPQINLWVYQTGDDAKNPQLMGSIDKGAQWISGQTTTQNTCSDVVFTVENRKGNSVKILITQEIEEVLANEAESLEIQQDAHTLVPTTYIDGLSAYPNPFAEFTTVQYQLEQSEEVALVLYNILGKQMATPISKKHQQRGIHQHRLNLKGLPKGIYLLSLLTSKGKQTIKVIYQ